MTATEGARVWVWVQFIARQTPESGARISAEADPLHV